jgi:dipeptidase E
MKLVFYSGGQKPTNRILHQTLAQLAGAKPRKSLTYIPVWSDGSDVFFNRMVRRLKRFGFTDFICLPSDQLMSAKYMREAFKSDVIYLPGGNTFYFLKHLRQNGFLPRLRAFVKRGGVLAGLSAGGIIMTPNIGLAAYPKFDADENDVKLPKKEWGSLKLVKFEFFPHYDGSTRLKDALMKYSKKKRYPIFAVKDGSGLVVKGRNIRLFGDVVVFEKGAIRRS